MEKNALVTVKCARKIQICASMIRMKIQKSQLISISQKKVKNTFGQDKKYLKGKIKMYHLLLNKITLTKLLISKY